MTILTREPLTANELTQIEDILRESNCPNESLRRTFARYSLTDNGVIYFDRAHEEDDVFKLIHYVVDS